MKLLKQLSKYKNFLTDPSRRYWVVGGVVLIILLVGAVTFVIPKKINFSYAGESCVSHLALFPALSHDSGGGGFKLITKDELKIGSFTYATTKVCAQPTKAPAPGNHEVSLAGVLAKKFIVSVGEEPEAHASSIVGQTISTALPLDVQLSSPDTVHNYKFKVGDRATECTPGGSGVLCEVADLGLAPGKKYTASLLRSFEQDEARTLIEGEVETLRPVVMKKAEVSKDKTVYNSPKKFEFTFDRSIEKAEITLERKVGDSKELVATTVSQDDNKVNVSFDEELARKATYVLTISQVVADNGSSLEKPIIINFKTSGGPKPKDVSVGSVGVARTAQIVVTLDQPMKKDVDISKYARVTGVSGSVKKLSSTKVAFSINGGLCKAFSLIIDKGVASDSNSAVSDAWKFDSRTVCGTTSVIGYSVNGRPIIAYYIGTGSSTVMFTGGIHGNELAAQQTMQAWANYLMYYGNQIPSNRRVVVVPNLNPDGIATGSRNNANNVNLGRNYPSSNWSASIDTANGELPQGGGSSPGSEPETKAIMALTRQLRPRLEVSFHSQGSLVGANKYGNSVAVGSTYANMVGYGTMFYNAEEVMGYSITGEYEEWMGEEMGIPAILIELPSHYGNYLEWHLKALLKTLTV